MKAYLVSHTHWDREWYRTFESFRARLVDTIDRVLELAAPDPGFRFLLDGQTIVLEDYLAVRPDRRKDLEQAVRAGRIAIGPWYVQPDSLLPSGEAHVRNLLEGRRVGAAFGPVSSVGYTPDSFGHPAQFPQLFAGFGLRAFVYWRGNPSELAKFPPEYLWQGPDGSSLVACHLGGGYFNAGNVARDPEAAASKIAHQAQSLVERTRAGRILLMNGFDHAAPCAETAAIAHALAERTGWEVERALVDDFVEGIPAELPVFSGELVGGCAGPLLPGVWSARLGLKLRNRACETSLERLAEPFAALARLHGLPDERPSLREAWRELLRNQAHDSIGGCSLDRVHAQMEPRYDACEELARETTLRALERLSGHGVARATPAGDAIELAVWNPSPFPRAGVVRVARDPWPSLQADASGPFFHRWLLPPRAGAGFRVDGLPARVVAGSPDGRFLIAPGSVARDLEFVVGAVPGFGWRRVRLEAADAAPDAIDAGREISCGEVGVRAADDGTFSVRLGARVLEGVCALEDEGDRGDSYDADPVPGGATTLESVGFERRCHASGIEDLCVERTLLVPARLAAGRESRSAERARVRVAIRARVAPGEPGVALTVRIENSAEDHRLRLLFPTGSACAEFLAATTFDTARRTTAKPDATGWIHPPPATFPHQGFVCANRLTVVAPGLPEAEVRADGTIALTCLRALGWLSRPDLRTRPGPAGPQIPVPGAQLPGALQAELRIFAADDLQCVAAASRESELPLQAVTIAGTPLVRENVALVSLEPRSLVLSALKPAEDGDGIVLRVQNPGSSSVRALVRTGFPLAAAHALRLDEASASFPLDATPESVAFEVPPHALRSVRLVASGLRQARRNRERVKTNRRDFLRTAGWASLALLGLPRAARSSEALVPDPDRLLALAPGFSYRVIARTGEEMSDGLLMPGGPDGTGVFPGPGSRLILVRNHEQGAAPRGSSAFGANFERLDRVALDRMYDAGPDRAPMLGGTTTLLYDPATGAVVASWLSLGGTLRNCAGGVTPWGSWLSCEEYPGNAGGPLARDHGFVFEVPATAEPVLTPARPLASLGRMNHEAAAVDAASGVVYLTEDRADSLFYRFLPDVPGDLARGGKLQALRFRDGQLDTRNWKDSPPFERSKAFPVDWVTLDGVEAPADDLRMRGHRELRAALFGRGEGIWASNAGVFFTATMGGAAMRGQIFRYVPSEREGRKTESAHPGTLELFLESGATTALNYPDNLTVAPWGELFVCEDGDGNDGLVRLDARGQLTTIARNLYSDSELTGVCFAPDGKTLFVHVQSPGISFAITGPFRGRA